MIDIAWFGALMLLPSLSLPAASPDGPSTLALGARHDVTLIETDGGALGDGRGPGLRAGVTNQNAASLRRAAISFDLAGSVPDGATIVSATLILSMSGANDEPSTVGLHRVLVGWGEGGSRPAGGGGAPAAPGDATWLHRFHNPAAPLSSPAWSRPGGDFVGHPSATAEVAGGGYYSWTAPRLAEDVQNWLNLPSSNHGWVILGDETLPGSVKLFDSRENADESVRPVLLIEFIPLDPDDEGSEDDEGGD